MSKKKSPRRAWNPAAGVQAMRHFMTLKSRKPLGREEVSQLSSKGWSALAAVRAGTASREHTADLCIIADVCSALCAKGLGVEYRAQCAAGAAVTKAIRSAQNDQMELTEPQIAALEELMTVHDAMLNSGLYAGEYVQVIAELHDSIG